MPCYDSRDDVRTIVDIRRITELECMLCGICTRAEALTSVIGASQLIGGDPALQAWWTVHKQVDVEKRVKEEADKQRELIRRSAAAKLTAEECEVLGIRW